MLSQHLVIPFCVPLRGYCRVLYGVIGIVSGSIGLATAIRHMQLWHPYLKYHDQRRKPSSQPHAVFSLSLSNALACIGESCYTHVPINHARSI